jgi:hypothetical protein
MLFLKKTEDIGSFAENDSNLPLKELLQPRKRSRFHRKVQKN